MPVATLRVWERRYALTRGAPSPGGQRRYSAEDVRRLTFLKQLTDRGHAIGDLVSLDMAGLQRVASTHAQVLSATQGAPSIERIRPRARRAVTAWRLAVVGPAFGARLQSIAAFAAFDRPVQMVGPFASIAQAAAACAIPKDGGIADAWLLQEPQLYPGWLHERAAALPALAIAPTSTSQPVPVAVLYGYAPEAVCGALTARGIALLREPQPDVVLVQWLRMWATTSASHIEETPRSPATVDAGSLPVAAPRWEDAALSDFAARSTTVACECPRHVAELLIQLSRFEAYSRNCEQRNAQDAELHHLLARAAGEARIGFEGALEQIALREGLMLPPAANAGSGAGLPT